MKSKDYWKKRAENISNLEFEKTDNYKKQLESQYEKALKTIQDDVENFYRKFADNNEISIGEARKLLNSNELKEFKMTLREFIRKANDNENLKWEKELNNVSYKVRITRLQSLQLQIKNSLMNLYDNQHKDTTELLKGIYSDAYYRSIFEIYKDIGIGVNFAKLNDKAVKRAVTEKWYGANYSDRIWKNRNKLTKELKDIIPQSVIRGDDVRKTSRFLAERMNVALGSARTLINTESSQILANASFDGYTKSGVVKQYEILATLDLHTSRKCRFMDGKVFDVDKKETGVNAPPFHPNCRTTTVPYFDDAVDEKRIARNHKGETYHVAGNIKYEDWYKEHVL